MRIGFDVSQTAGEKAGCGFVADQLIQSLLKIDEGNEYILYPVFYTYRNPSFLRATQPQAKNCRVHFKGMPFQDMVNKWDEKVDDRTEWLGSPDIIHSNNFSCIKDHRAKIVFTLYDVTPMVYPEFTTEENRLVCFDGLFNASLYADHCIAISEYTKKSFLHYFPHYPVERITVAHLGTRSAVGVVRESALPNKILGKYGLEAGDFWLGVGTIEPRKNYRLLIDAYNELKDRKPLIIAGGKGWLESDIGDKVKEIGLHDRIRFLCYVSDEELSVLYSSCFAFVYPSLFEGFGLPVLEAMSCGAAVITSDSSSLPEVGGDAVLYIDPSCGKDLVEKMRSLTHDPLLVLELRMKARKRATMFSWADTARIVFKAYEKVMREEPWFKR